MVASLAAKPNIEVQFPCDALFFLNPKPMQQTNEFSRHILRCSCLVESRTRMYTHIRTCTHMYAHVRACTHMYAHVRTHNSSSDTLLRFTFNCTQLSTCMPGLGGFSGVDSFLKELISHRVNKHYNMNMKTTIQPKKEHSCALN